MNRHRIRFIREKALEIRRNEQLDADSRAATATRPMESSRVLEGMDALDAGCSGSILSESLARLSANKLAIDASAENIGITMRHVAADPGLMALSFRHASAKTPVQEGKRFDVICSMGVVEHVDNRATPTRFTQVAVRARVSTCNNHQGNRARPARQHNLDMVLASRVVLCP